MSRPIHVRPMALAADSAAETAPAQSLDPTGDEKPPHSGGALDHSPESSQHQAVPENRLSLGRAVRARLAPSPRPTKEDKVAARRTNAFRQRFFPQAADQDWDSWVWQVKNRVTSPARLAAMLALSDQEKAAFRVGARNLPLSITPYFLSLIDPQDPLQALRRTMVPTADELVVSPGEAEDPLAEDEDAAAPGLIHRYPDRVLLLVSGSCAAYCRYCTRHRMVAGRRDDCGYNRRRLETALAYISGHTEIRDVLLSGGDPLLLTDRRLEWVIRRLRRIPHVEIIRLGTKTPAVLPQRITHDLTRMLSRYHPLFMSLHFTHPDELTPETRRACARLADAGIPLGSQTVLLKGVNDDPETLRRLFQGLLTMRVRPYYLYQCDPIPGSAHFRTPVSKGLEVIQALRGHTTGYAVPTYVIDAPGGGGKIALYPDSVVGRDGDSLVLRNYEEKNFIYPDNAGGAGPAIH